MCRLDHVIYIEGAVPDHGHPRHIPAVCGRKLKQFEMADHDQQSSDSEESNDMIEESSDMEEISEEERLVSELTKMGGASRVLSCTSVALLYQLAMGMIDTV